MDFTHLCRFCAEKSTNLHSVFVNNNSELTEKIKTCSPIEIAVDDDLPTAICQACYSKLNAAYDFRLLILSADKKLKSWLKKAPSNYENDLYMEPICNIKSETEETSDHDSNKSEDSDEPSCNEKSDTSEDRDDVVKKINHKKKVKQKPIASKTSICPICGRELKRNSFKDHMSNVHKPEADIECNVCGKMLKNKRQLWHHKRTHESRTIKCDQCEKLFKSREGYRIHFRHIHLGIKNYSCKFCNKTFDRSTALKRHMRSHTGEKPFVCSYCSRSFSGSWNLKQHIRLHTKERPYSCDKCDEAFTQNVMLKIHIKNKHPVADKQSEIPG